MRERKTWLVVTFHTTAAAIGMEKLCAARGLAGRLIPVPRALTADCGMGHCNWTATFFSDFITFSGIIWQKRRIRCLDITY